MKARTAYALVGLLLVVEWCAFSQFYKREVLTSFPRFFDQAAYLSETIDLYHTWLEHGFVAGLRQSLSGAWQHGFLVQHEAAFAYFFLGPTRLSAVTVSFVHLAALQLLIVWLALRAGRPLSGLAICGVLLSARTLMREPGGLPDFRLDLAGSLLVSAVGLLVVASRGFRLRGWSVAVGLVGGVACLTRMIMAPYLAIGYTTWLLVAIWLRHRPTVRPRLLNALVAASVTGALVLPFALAQFRALYGYYFVGTVTSDEKWLRAREFGIFTLSDHLIYYARSAAGHHAGYAFIVVSVSFLILAGLRARGLASRSVSEQDPDRGDAWWAAGFIACVAVGAYAILTVTISKSPIVGTVFIGLAIPLLWLAVGGIRPEAQRRWEDSPWVAWALVLVLVGGVGTFVHRCTRPSSLRLPTAEVANYLGVVDLIASTPVGGRSPTISFDELTEFFNIYVIKVLSWERHGIFLEPKTGLGEVRIGLDAISRDEALADLGRSDFALLGSDRARGGGSTFYPLNRSLQQWSNDLVAWASMNMVPMREAAFFGRRVTVFVKPTIGCDVESGEWITSDGMRCVALGAALRLRPVLAFHGGAYPRRLGGIPSVHASIQPGNSTSIPIPLSCEYRPGAERDGALPYTVRCTVCPPSIPDDSVATIRVTFDRYFVPRSLGINNDERQLAVQVSDAPTLESALGTECRAGTETPRVTPAK